MDGNLAAKVAQDGPKRGQEGPRWPEKGSPTYHHRIYSMIAARFGGHFGAILGFLGASEANLGVSSGAHGLFLGGFCRAKLRATCCEEGK